MQPAFLPQTTLTPEQTRCNFTLLDNPLLDLLLSPEAEKACSKMFLIYGRLKRADWKLWERTGVLYLGGDADHTAWEMLCDLAGVASATLSKALKWMAERNVIAYFARKNGAGIRIYFNVALNSVKRRSVGEKKLRLVPASSGEPRTSFAEVPSCEDIVFTKDQNSDLDAPRENPAPAATPPDLPLPATTESAPVAPTSPTLRLVPPAPPQASTELRLAVVEALSRKMEQLERTLQDLARSVPNKAWLENALVPKAIRVALAEVFRQQQRGRAKPSHDPGRAQPDVADALHDNELARQADAWAEAALAALPPDEYAARLAALELHASNDPRYAKVRWADDDVKRTHFEALLKRELLEATTQPTERKL